MKGMDKILGDWEGKQCSLAVFFHYSKVVALLSQLVSSGRDLKQTRN